MELVDQILVTFFIAIFLSFLVAKLFSLTLVPRDDDTGGRAPDQMNSGKAIGRIVTADDTKHMKKSARFLDRETRVLDIELQGEGSAELLDHQDAKGSHDGVVLLVEDAEKLLPEEQADTVELPVEDCEVIMEEIKRGQEPEIVGTNRDQETEPVAGRSSTQSENNDGEEVAKPGDVELESNTYDSVHNLREDTKVAGMIDGGDDDDWEGVERSELDDKFAAAAVFVANKEKHETLLTSDVLMQLDRLHKIATEGPCYEPLSMPLMMSARAKWNSWQRKGNVTSPEVAMEQYVSLLSDKVPGWMDDNAVKPA